MTRYAGLLSWAALIECGDDIPEGPSAFDIGLCRTCLAKNGSEQ